MIRKTGKCLLAFLRKYTNPRTIKSSNWQTEQFYICEGDIELERVLGGTLPNVSNISFPAPIHPPDFKWEYLFRTLNSGKRRRIRCQSQRALSLGKSSFWIKFQEFLTVWTCSIITEKIFSQRGIFASCVMSIIERAFWSY